MKSRLAFFAIPALLLSLLGIAGPLAAMTGLTVVAAQAAAVCASPGPGSFAPTAEPSGAAWSTSASPSEPPAPADPPCESSESGVQAVVLAHGVVATDAAAAVAVAAAIEAVGRHGRYVAEGNGPVDFDCSGLTAYAWRAAGVGLVDYSYTQWSQTRRIGREDLAPGDLVFWFGGDVHHVAIVVGVEASRVQIAEAANPDAGIRIRDLAGSWDEAYLSGYGRVVRP